MDKTTDGDDWLVVPCESHGPKRQVDDGEPQTDAPELHKAWVLGLHGPDLSFFKLLVWHSGLEGPVGLTDATHKSLVVAVDKQIGSKTLQKLVQQAAVTLPQLQEAFPEMTKTRAADSVQVCSRVDEKTPWKVVGIEELFERSDEEMESLQEEEDESVDEEVVEVPAGVQMNELLVETRFVASSGDGLVDWRLGRFYSDIQENAWRFQLQMGQVIDALDSDKRWYESRVVGMDPGHVKVHYRGWTSKWDEWLHRMSSRLAPLHTYVRNWRDFEVGDEVMVGTEVDGKKYPEWRNACVTARESAREDGSVHIELDIDGSKYWMDAEDEMLCPKGTHKAMNATVKEAAAVLAAPPSLLPDYFDLPEDPLRPPPKEADSVREKMQNMQFSEGDDWCVVDDDFNADGDTETTAENIGQDDNNQITSKEDTNQEGANRTVPEEAIYRDSISETSSQSATSECNADNDSNGESTDDVDGFATPATDNMFATTSDLCDEDSKKESWRFKLEVGQLLDALDTDNVWYESRVVALSSTLVKVHYRGWTSKWDEWLERTSSRIAPLHTKLHNWRAFKVHDEVLVGRRVSTKKYPEWRNGVVTACLCDADGSLQIEVDIDGAKSWLDAQDELLCPPGTHKTLNAQVLTRASSLF